MNYKRKYPRSAARSRKIDFVRLRKSVNLKPYKVPSWKERDKDIDYWPDWRGYIWLNCYPRWWDITFHTRRYRAKNKSNERKVLKGKDSEDLIWSDYRKPHIYYW